MARKKYIFRCPGRNCNCGYSYLDNSCPPNKTKNVTVKFKINVLFIVTHSANAVHIQQSRAAASLVIFKNNIAYMRLIAFLIGLKSNDFDSAPLRSVTFLIHYGRNKGRREGVSVLVANNCRHTAACAVLILQKFVLMEGTHR